MRRTTKTIGAIFLAAVFVLASFSGRAHAEDMMQSATRNAVYGGIVGALVGAAATLLSDQPEDKLSYIPTGAGVGILLGAAYGVASSGVVQSVGSYEDGKFTFGIPTVKLQEIYDETTDSTELVEHVELIRVKF